LTTGRLYRAVPAPRSHSDSCPRAPPPLTELRRFRRFLSRARVCSRPRRASTPAPLAVAPAVARPPGSYNSPLPEEPHRAVAPPYPVALAAPFDGAAVAALCWILAAPLSCVQTYLFQRNRRVLQMLVSCRNVLMFSFRLIFTITVQAQTNVFGIVQFQRNL
jgi:hypothetical protein